MPPVGGFNSPPTLPPRALPKPCCPDAPTQGGFALGSTCCGAQRGACWRSSCSDHSETIQTILRPFRPVLQVTCSSQGTRASTSPWVAEHMVLVLLTAGGGHRSDAFWGAVLGQGSYRPPCCHPHLHEAAHTCVAGRIRAGPAHSIPIELPFSLSASFFPPWRC